MKMVILDRDGVINYDSDEYIKSPEEWHAIPGSLHAIATLNRSGFKTVVATNQSGIARGHYDVAMLDRIHEKLMYELAAVGGYIEEFYFCPHHPDEKCLCRKPQPGLLLRIQQTYRLDLANTYFIGDSWVDIEAAQLAGCQPLLVLTGKGAQTLQERPALGSIPHFADLAEATNYVLSQQK